MKKETEETLKTIIGIFAIIGIFSTLIFIYELFDKDDTTTDTTICEEYESKIDNLEEEIEDLQSELSVKEDEVRELESSLEAWKEEYNSLEKSKGCASSGKSKIPLTDGPSGN